MPKCPECNQNSYNYKLCNPCNSKHFQNDFNNWTSGNNEIDKFIQDVKRNASNSWQVIEWIPKNNFYIFRWKFTLKQIDILQLALNFMESHKIQKHFHI